MLKQFLRSHFWIVIGSFLLSSTYLLAQTTTQAIRLWLPPSSPYRLPRQFKGDEDGDALTKLHAQYAILNKSNLFDPDQQPIVPVVKKKPKKTKDDQKQKSTATCDPKGTYRPSNLPLQLKGTSIASDPAYSVAAVYDARRRKVVALRAGDNYRGLLICAIEREEKPNNDPKSALQKIVKFYVKYDRGRGQLEYLESGKGPGNGRSRHISSMYNRFRKLRQTKIDLSDIKKGKNGTSITRGLINTLTNRLDWVGAQAAIVPYFKRGKAAGFRIKHIKRGSLYTKLGLRNGDVIQRINGYVINSPQRALEAYSNLMSADNISVDIVRRGKSKNMSYQIKD